MKKEDEKALFAELRRLTLAKGDGESVFPLDVATRLGMHPNRAAFIFGKWTGQGLYNYGVNVCFGWLTPEALALEEGLK